MIHMVAQFDMTLFWIFFKDTL